MSFQDTVQYSKKYFPDLQVKYKNQSFFMKLLSYLLFFNKSFMTNYATTVGSTVYFPNEIFIKVRSISSIIILLHELVHINDAKKISKPLFGFLYLFPQILVLLFFPMLFVSWKIAICFLLLIAPIPAFFRMYFEKRAYFASLYCLNVLGKQMNFKVDMVKQKDFFVAQFKNPYYYFMWPFKNLDTEFNDALVKVNANQRPYEDNIFNILDDLMTSIGKG